MRRSKLSLPPRRDGPAGEEDRQMQQQQQQQHSGGHIWPATETPDQQTAGRKQPATAAGTTVPLPQQPTSSLDGVRSLQVAPTKTPAARASSATRRSPPKTAQQPASPPPRSPWAHSRSRKRSLPQSFPSPPCGRQEAVLIDLTEEEGVDRHRYDRKEEQTRSIPPPVVKVPRVASSSRESSPICTPSFAELPSLLGSLRPPSPTLSRRPSTAPVPPLKAAGTATISSTRPSASVPPEATVAATIAAASSVAAAEAAVSPAVALPLLPPPPPPAPRPDPEKSERPRSTYLRHFEDAVDTVMRVRPDYARLFTPEEREMAERFARLSCASKTLYVRLFQRKGPWFRVDGMLGYDEVGSGTPLWVRRRAAAAAAAAAATAAAVSVGVGESSSASDIDGEEERGSLVFSPSNPFSRPELAGASVHDTISSDDNIDRVSQQCNGASTKTEDVVMKEGAGGAGREQCEMGDEVAAAAAAAAAAAVAAETIALSPQELTVLHGEIQSALRELVAAGFLNPLPEHVCRDGPALEAALAGVECCLRSPEIQTLLKRTGGGKTPAARPQGKKTGRASLVQRKVGTKGRPGDVCVTVGGRRGMIEDLRRRLAGQQTLWGAKLPLVDEVERLVSISVESMGVDVTTSTRRVVDGRGGSGRCGSADGGKFGRQEPKQRRYWLVLVTSDPRLVFKRALRLMYLTCNTSALSSGRVGAASVRGAGAAGAISSWSPGLSVAFGKTRYASYTCDPRARAFQGREDFLRWEAAVELRCALDGVMAELAQGQSGGGTRPRAADSEEEHDQQETQSDAIPEVVVLDSSDEEVGEASMVAKEEEGIGETSVRVSQEDGFRAGKEEEEEEIRASLDGLEECVAQFLPDEKGDGVFSSVVPAAAAHTATAAAAAVGTSAAVAIALICARCLHAHLGTPPTVLASRSRVQTALEQDTSADEDETFLLSLQRACSGGADVSEAWRGSVNGQFPGTKEEEEEEEEAKPADRATTVPLVSRTVDRNSNDWRRQEGDLPVPPHVGDSRGGDNSAFPRAMGEEGPSGKFSPSHPLSRQAAEGTGPGRTEEEEKRDNADISPSRALPEVCCEVPEFLLQLEAGWVLASAVWEGVALLERARGYERAVELLVQLLATRYTSHRRGRWWNRLSLDLAHTGRPRCALWAAQEGLRDPRVRGGDRLALEKRAAMLASRVSNKTKAAGAPLHPPPAAGAGSTSPRPRTAVVAPANAASVGSSSCCSTSASDLAPNDATPRASSVADDKGKGGEDDDDDDDDGIFQDPAVERESRRRKQKRRRKRRQQQQQQQRQQQAQQVQKARGRYDDITADGGTSDASHFAGSGPSVAVGANSRTARWGGYSDGVMEVPRKAEDARTCTNAPDGAGDREVGRASSVGGSGLGSSTAAPAAAPAAADAAVAAADTMRCEGLAELSEVPDLLRDESIGAVVLAATVEEVVQETGRAAGDDFGVPEMTITGRRLNREVGVKSRFVGYGDGATCTVESLVLQHLSQQEEGSWAGWHCEGSPLQGLWALLMWDVLFMDVPDVFQTPFQDAPLDLDFCPLFYLNRREAVDARLAEVRAASPAALSALVGQAWIANADTVCRGVNWQRTSVRYLQAVAVGLGGRAVAATLAALCLNHKHFGGGLPDLLLMRAVRTSVVGGASATGEESSAGGRAPATAATAQDTEEVSTPERFVSWLGVDSGALDEARVSDGETRVGVGGGGDAKKSPAAPPFEAIDLEGLQVETWLLEVKGPSDRLSDRQTAWLKILDRGGARVGVCHVAEGSGGSHVHKSSTKAKAKSKAEPAC